MITQSVDVRGEAVICDACKRLIKDNSQIVITLTAEGAHVKGFLTYPIVDQKILTIMHKECQ